MLLVVAASAVAAAIAPIFLGVPGLLLLGVGAASEATASRGRGGDEGNSSGEPIFVRQAQLFHQEIIKSCSECCVLLASDEVSSVAEPRIDVVQ